jgi:hypothetical protein
MLRWGSRHGYAPDNGAYPLPDTGNRWSIRYGYFPQSQRIDRRDCARIKTGCFARSTLVEYRVSGRLPGRSARILALAVKGLEGIGE